MPRPRFNVQFHDSRELTTAWTAHPAGDKVRHQEFKAHVQYALEQGELGKLERAGTFLKFKLQLVRARSRTA